MTLIALTSEPVPRNMLTEQQFNFRLESGVEGAYLWHDEITQAIAMSCVPQEILDEKEQIKQIKDLLQWFKHEFFTWCDKPACPSCGTNSNMERGGSE